MVTLKTPAKINSVHVRSVNLEEANVIKLYTAAIIIVHVHETGWNPVVHR